MHFLYVLYSKSIDKFYIGESSNVEERLILHNEGYYKKSFTKKAKDWKIQLKYKCDSRSQALFLEKFIKRMKSKTFIQKVIDNPGILSNILEKRY